MLLYAMVFQAMLFHTTLFHTNTKGEVSMNPTTVRIIALVLFVIFVTIIVWRRKNMASKRKHVL